MIITSQILGSYEFELSMFPVKRDFFRAFLQLPCEGMDRPFCVQLLVFETEWLAATENADVTIRKLGFF